MNLSLPVLKWLQLRDKGEPNSAFQIISRNVFSLCLLFHLSLCLSSVCHFLSSLLLSVSLSRTPLTPNFYFSSMMEMFASFKTLISFRYQLAGTEINFFLIPGPIYFSSCFEISNVPTKTQRFPCRHESQYQYFEGELWIKYLGIGGRVCGMGYIQYSRSYLLKPGEFWSISCIFARHYQQGHRDI